MDMSLSQERILCGETRHYSSFWSGVLIPVILSAPSIPPPPSIPSTDAVAAAAVAEPYLDNTKVRHYCDCGTGADSSCVAGNDSTGDGSAGNPYKTIGAAATWLRSNPGTNYTAALCKGGAFGVTGGMKLGSSNCTAGTYCNDLREYTPSWYSGSNKPLIYWGSSGTIFNFDGNYGGLRIMNLKMTGTFTAGNNSKAFFFNNGAHDVKMWNLDLDHFDMPIYNTIGGASPTSNIILTGSNITDAQYQGYFGAGNGMQITYNYFTNDGGQNVLYHAIYLGGGKPATNMLVQGNYITGQQGSTCTGSPITAHLEVDGFTISGNTIIVDPAAATGGCWGMDLSNGGYGTPIYFRHTVISGNTFVNGGNLALSVVSCPGCVIENNLIINEWNGAGMGIAAPASAARTSPADDVNTNNIIRNNTIYYGPNAANGMRGIVVGTEGTGHIIANNTVYYAATSSKWQNSCYAYGLPLSSYSFINNNSCYSAYTGYRWENTQGSLSAWQTYAQSFGFDTASFTGDPQFTAVGTDFTPAAGSPLIGAGNATYGSATDITGKTRSIPPSIGAYN
jgi:hypothetical protein